MHAKTTCKHLNNGKIKKQNQPVKSQILSNPLNKNLRKSFNDADIFLIVVIIFVLIISSIFAFRKSNPQTSYAICEIDGKPVRKISLDKEQKIDLNNGMELEVKKGRIRVSKSDCPQQICVKHSWLKYNSDIIVCVPNRCIVYVDKQHHLDYISR